MLIETFTLGSLSTNCYVVFSQQTKEAIIIDPGLDLPSEADQIFDYVAQAGLKIKLIVNTHGHPDHINGDAVLQEKYNVPICIHRLDAASLALLENVSFPPTVLLDEGTLIKFGNESLTVMHTPGHTPGSVCLLGERLVFTGDTLFAGGIGRTDFPGGSESAMRLSLQRLARLPDYFLIYPGHGRPSVMGEEKRVNPFLTN
ncbi:MAG TPA: MBL fold metallo-hydrolase [Candidatus Limnocylindrales bacterium]|nr:MBL fold metallo-hydrolase [Candidatus Limnocylindrales bacterium]